MTWPIWVLGAMAVGAALANLFAWRTGRARVAPLLVAVVLILTQIGGNLAVGAGEWRPYLFVLIDTLAGIACYAAMENNLDDGRDGVWLLALVATFALDLGAHVAYEAAPDPSFRIYAAQLNVIFGLQVLIAGWSGGRVLVGLVSGKLFRPRGFLGHTGI